MRYDRHWLESICWGAGWTFPESGEKRSRFPRDSADGRRNLGGDYARAARDDTLATLILGIHGLLQRRLSVGEISDEVVPRSEFSPLSSPAGHCHADNRLAHWEKPKRYARCPTIESHAPPDTIRSLTTAISHSCRNLTDTTPYSWPSLSRLFCALQNSNIFELSRTDIWYISNKLF